MFSSPACTFHVLPFAAHDRSLYIDTGLLWPPFLFPLKVSLLFGFPECLSLTPLAAFELFDPFRRRNGALENSSADLCLAPRWKVRVRVLLAASTVGKFPFASSFLFCGHWTACRMSGVNFP